MPPSPAAATALRRALLYVPSSSKRMLAKSLTLKADNVTHDLEDSVAPDQKEPARALLAQHLTDVHHQQPLRKGIGELAVRINAVSTRYAEGDLEAVGPLPAVEAIVIPKVNTAADLRFVADKLAHLAPHRVLHHRDEHDDMSTGDRAPRPGPIKLIALIESAQAILNLPQICAFGTSADCQGSPLEGLIFAAEDFAHDLSLTRTPSLKEFLYARSAIVTHARAFDLPSTIDLVCTEFRGTEGTSRLEAECVDGKGMGFNGKQCIHPSQVAHVQRLFGPSEHEVDWAARVATADRKASMAGRGAWTLDGKMIDAPVVLKAKATLERAKKCGLDMERLRGKWKHQEPE